ncbi:MAG: 4-(cytidine 5'-diphospho)-2-C-methyl-D-erythritol kinase [Clostridia bacterium]|nr:4-(cytidine 5'-diphospho)-2-C-methyl-D-erythritol kinase [Clostridia bacterium]
MSVRVTAPAKINLTLYVEGKRADGYHELTSVFQTVTLADTVILEQADHIKLSCSDPALPTDERNTAHRAAAAFFAATGIQGGATIHIEKRIPQQAGLGGGSADAAGVLVGLNALYDAGLSTADLCRIGASVGADVPFCVAGGTAMVTGIGEILRPLPPMPDCAIAIVKPPIGVSTKEAYQAVDALPKSPADRDAMCRALQNGDLIAIARLLDNDFERALCLPEVERAKDQLRSFSPLGVSMSGSGSAVFALFDREETALAAAKATVGVFCRPSATGAAVTMEN